MRHQEFQQQPPISSVETDEESVDLLNESTESTESVTLAILERDIIDVPAEALTDYSHLYEQLSEEITELQKSVDSLEPPSPMYDAAFKQVFTQPDIVSDFILAVEKDANPNCVDTIQTVDASSAEYTHDLSKVIRTDVRVRTSRGHLYDLEMQQCIESSTGPRMLYYLAHIFGSQLASGDHYSKLMPVSLILISKRPLDPDARTHTMYAMRDPFGKGPESLHVMRIHSIALNKISEDGGLSPHLRAWLLFIKTGRVEDGFAKVQEARKILQQCALDPEHRQRRVRRLQDLKATKESLRQFVHSTHRKDEVIRQKDETICQKDEAIRQKDEAIRQKDKAIRQLQQQLQAISNPLNTSRSGNLSS